jgi:hypothetical protein
MRTTAIFAVMVVVLPVPAPARISWGGLCVGWIRAGGVLGRRRGSLRDWIPPFNFYNILS